MFSCGTLTFPKRHLAKPAMLVDLINHFGKIDGFKDILERISDSEFKLSGYLSLLPQSY